MATIEEIVQQQNPGALPGASEAAEEIGGSRGGFDFGFLLTPTGPGDIEDYLQHPLNAPKSKGLAQMLRGLTGFFGEGLRAALADIIVGGMEYMRERANKANDADTISR